MEKKAFPKSRLWFVLLFLLLIGLGISALTHHYVPFMTDDLWYSTKLFSGEPIGSLSDIVEAQKWHYLNWGGRAITHTILQLVLLLGENKADVLNILMTLLLCFVCVLVATGTKKSDTSVIKKISLPAFFSAFACMLGLNANWEMSMFWQAGAANYLYITSFLLLYFFLNLQAVEHALEGDVQTKRQWLLCMVMLPLGLICGWSNENMGPTLWVISLLCILLLKRKQCTIPPWMLVGNVTCLLGATACILAPGNFVRYNEIKEETYGIFWRLFLRGYYEGRAAVDYLFPALCVAFGLFVLGKCALKIPLGVTRVMLLLAALLSWGAMVLSPHYPDRASFGTMMLLICFAISYGKDIVQEKKELLLPLMCGSILIWLRGMYFLGEFLGLCWGWIR